MTSSITQLSKHIWLMSAEHETDRPILAAIVGERRTLLLDAGNSPAHAEFFRQQLQDLGLRSPDLLVLTHWHWDHTFGMSAWNIPSIAHQRTAELLHTLAAEGGDWSDDALQRLIPLGLASEMTITHIQREYGADRSGIKLIPPDILAGERLHLDLGGVHCELRHVGGDHTEDSCYLYVQEDRTLFLGDALGPSVYGGPRRYRAESFLRLLSIVEEYETDLLVESHSEPMTREAFEADIRPWRELARLVQRYSPDRPRVERELREFLGLPSLQGELAMAVDGYFAI